MLMRWCPSHSYDFFMPRANGNDLAAAQKKPLRTTVQIHSSQPPDAAPSLPTNAALNTAGVVGVLGGMGPLSTIDFMRKMLSATPASVDQDHVPVVVSSIPQVPDRTRAFRGEGESPLAAMLASAQRLVGAGAGLIVIPCNTAHLWFEALQGHLALPMLHLVDAALEEAFRTVGNDVPIGLLATDATLSSGLYFNRRPPAAQNANVKWLLPTAGEMLNLVMPGIEAVKSGDLPEGQNKLAAAAAALQSRGAQAVILGCTEIPLVLNEQTSPLPVIDATAALAHKAVVWSLKSRLPQR
jgi:aspartate racemase